MMSSAVAARRASTVLKCFNMAFFRFSPTPGMPSSFEEMLAQGLNIPMIGLAKRIEEIVLPDEDESLLLDRHSPALHVLQRVRDESHRFAIIHHRALRGRASIASRLDGIPGVGEKRKKAILKHFKTVEALKAASAEEIAQVPGVPEKVAEAVWRFLHEEEAAEHAEP